MLNLIYSGALTTLLIGLAMLIQYEHNHRINSLSRGVLIVASFAYAITFLLFSEPISFKSTILLRDISLVFCVLVTFRIIRNSKIIFPVVLVALIFGMSSFGFNHLHDSFKISKFSILKEASVSNDGPNNKKANAKKRPKLSAKSSDN